MLLLIMATIVLVVMVVGLFICYRQHQLQREEYTRRAYDTRLKNYNLDRPPFEMVGSKISSLNDFGDMKHLN